MNELQLSILFAGAGAVSLGLADFFAKKTSSLLGSERASLVTQILGLPLVAALFIYMNGSFEFNALAIGISALAGLLFAAGLVASYEAFHIGPLAITSPIVSSYAIISVIIAVFLFEEILTPGQFLAILFVILGVALTSIEFQSGRVNLKSSRGVRLALGGMLLFGVVMAVDGLVVDEVGWLQTLLMAYVFVPFAILALMGRHPRALRIKKSDLAWSTVLTTLFQLAAVTCIYIGFEKGLISVVAPVSAAYPVVTIFLGLVVLRERVYPLQLLGIAITIGGLVMLAL